MVSQARPLPLVSAVIPTFNRAALTCRAIDSALAQTHGNMEVVVVDDGSTDGTQAVLERKYAEEPRLVLIRVENGGVSRARNIGIRHATGDFVGFLDSDDFWYPWKIELQLKCLQLTPRAGMIWTDMDAVEDGGDVVQRAYLRTMYTAHRRLAEQGLPLFTDVRTMDPRQLGIDGVTSPFTLSQGNIFSQMIIGSVVHTSTCLLRRERLEHVGGFREDLLVSGEDYDFHLRTCREGDVAFADIPTIGYTIGRSDQLTSRAMIIHIARNSLRTLEPILLESRHLIALSAETIDDVLAGRNEWIAREFLSLGERRQAAAYIVKSLRYRPRSAHLYELLVACLLPKAGLDAVLALRRSIHKLSSRSRGEPGER